MCLINAGVTTQEPAGEECVLLGFGADPLGKTGSDQMAI